MARVQMDLNELSMNRLKAIKEKVEASSYADVMKEALKIYEYMLNEEISGTEFFIRKNGGEITPVKLFIA